MHCQGQPSFYLDQGSHSYIKIKFEDNYTLSTNNAQHVHIIKRLILL